MQCHGEKGPYSSMFRSHLNIKIILPTTGTNITVWIKFEYSKNFIQVQIQDTFISESKM